MINGKQTIALIQARASSTRLPKKHFRYIGHKRMIDWIVDRLKKIEKIDKIVISTSNHKTDDIFVNYGDEKGIEVFCYEGDINDVVGRHYSAAKKYEADYITVISGDCPLIDEGFIRKQLRKISQGYDYIRPSGKEWIHEGIDTYNWDCFKFLNKNSKSDYDRENFGVILRNTSDLVNIGLVNIDKKFNKKLCRISVDNLADLKFMNALYSDLNEKELNFNLSNVVDLLKEKSKLKEINSHVEQKKQKENTYRFLIKTEASKNIGLGHIRRMVVLGRYLNENKNNGVFYAINNNDEAKNILEGAGYIYDYKITEQEDELIDLINNYTADILIIDDKNINYNFKEIKRVTGLNKIVVIDKIIDDKEVDLSIIQGVQTDAFEEKFSDRNNIVYGMDTVFINDQFIKAKQKRIDANKSKVKIALSFGGTDPNNLTTQTIKELQQIKFKQQVKFKIILGPYFRFDNELFKELKEFQYEYEVVKDPDVFAEELIEVDYGIIAYGVSYYEFLYLGIPVIVYSLNDNDKDIVEKLEGYNKLISLDNLKDNIYELLDYDSIDLQVGNLGNMNEIYDLIIS